MKTMRRISLALCVLFLVALPSVVSAHPAHVPAVAVISISPNQAYNCQSTPVTITGSGFVATPTARLNNVPLSNVTFVDDATLTAIVPPDLPGGSYTLTVTNDGDQSASLANAFTVLMSGDGNLGPWSNTSMMSVWRAGVAAVVGHGFIYSLGGKDTGAGVGPITYYNTVERAAINSDGSLGQWQLVNSMLTARVYVEAVVVGDYIYAIGGLNGSGSLTTVERAVINPDGTLGAWNTASSLSTARSHFGAVAVRNYIYALGGYGSLNSVERAQVMSDGTLGPWQSQNAMATTHDMAAAVGSFLYASGGSSPGVEMANINPDGSLGSWVPVTTETRKWAVISRGYMYGFMAYNGLCYPLGWTAIQIDGTLDPWYFPLDPANFQPACIVGIPEYPAIVVAGPYMYVLGGETFFHGGDPTNVAEWARVQPMSVSSMNPSGTSGLEPITVTVDGSNFIENSTLSLNDSIGLPVIGYSLHTLTATLPAGLASGWYTATVAAPDGQRASLANALRIDSIGPVADGITINDGALSTTSTSVVLTLSASDATDDSFQMELSNDGLNWSSWQAFWTPAGWNLTSGDGTKTVYARFRDPVGNLSQVISDTIDLDTAAGTYYGVTINSGALFTNQTSVILTIGAVPKTPRMMVSNDGGFAGAQWQPFASRKSWEITQFGSYVIPRVVYVRYGDTDGRVLNTSQDDIILDMNPPVGSVTIVDSGSSGMRRVNSPVILALSATDDVSGVGGMQISNRLDFADVNWEPYATSRSWTLDATKTVYVQYRDNAGNVSQRYSAALPGGVWSNLLPLVTK